MSRGQIVPGSEGEEESSEVNQMDGVSDWLIEFITNILTSSPKTLFCPEAMASRIHRELARPIKDILTSLEQSGMIKNINGFYILAPDHGGSAEDINEWAKRFDLLAKP